MKEKPDIVINAEMMKVENDSILNQILLPGFAS